jgi:hypothetical protein
VRGRWAVWVGVVGALAAACLLAVLAWPGRGKDLVPSPPTRESARQSTPRPPDDSAGIAGWQQARRVPDGTEPPTFSWPLEEPAPVGLSTSIPPDLLE